MPGGDESGGERSDRRAVRDVATHSSELARSPMCPITWSSPLTDRKSSQILDRFFPLLDTAHVCHAGAGMQSGSQIR